MVLNEPAMTGGLRNGGGMDGSKVGIMWDNGDVARCTSTSWVLGSFLSFNPPFSATKSNKGCRPYKLAIPF
ncbi:hypothetical protein I308_102111 [Cryptococcus tetragattii IND107]|uniref:Uncharacterized protein n=1 Tax=Cryptococcus tetragattii IND107 TaxID=1296105 RepID=A0ABR3BWF3_9TREE